MLLLGLRRAVRLVLDNGGLFLKTESVVGGSRSRGRGRRDWVCGRRQHAGAAYVLHERFTPDRQFLRMAAELGS